MIRYVIFPEVLTKVAQVIILNSYIDSDKTTIIVGIGIMPGESGSFSFTSLPVSITNSTGGWWHSWENDSQTAIRNFSEFTGATGPEIPAIPEPETYTMLMIGLGLVGFIMRRKQVTSRA